MRPVRGTALGVLATTALLTLPAGALALGEPGGAVAPSSSRAGGSQFGLPAAVVRPEVAELRVPSSIVAGRPPAVTVEITERGVATVSMHVFVINLSTRQILVTANMGWVRTGRRLSVPWPAGARLPTGVYHVKVSAHDHRNGNVLRTAHDADVATLTVTAPKSPSPPSQPTTETGAPTPAQTVADGAVFPVQGPHNFGGPENRFGAPRAGHIHEGQDILTAEGTPDVVPLAGTIESTSYQAGAAGYYVVEHTTYGLDFMFAHCMANSFTVREGEAVGAGQQICRAGQTGDATTPHLHFELWVGAWQAGGHPIDPLPYLEAWERG